MTSLLSFTSWLRSLSWWLMAECVWICLLVWKKTPTKPPSTKFLSRCSVGWEHENGCYYGQSGLPALFTGSTEQLSAGCAVGCVGGWMGDGVCHWERPLWLTEMKARLCFARPGRRRTGENHRPWTFKGRPLGWCFHSVLLSPDHLGTCDLFTALTSTPHPEVTACHLRTQAGGGALKYLATPSKNVWSWCLATDLLRPLVSEHLRRSAEKSATLPVICRSLPNALPP